MIKWWYVLKLLPKKARFYDTIERREYNYSCTLTEYGVALKRFRAKFNGLVQRSTDAANTA